MDAGLDASAEWGAVWHPAEHDERVAANKADRIERQRPLGRAVEQDRTQVRRWKQREPPRFQSLAKVERQTSDLATGRGCGSIILSEKDIGAAGGDSGAAHELGAQAMEHDFCIEWSRANAFHAH